MKEYKYNTSNWVNHIMGIIICVCAIITYYFFYIDSNILLSKENIIINIMINIVVLITLYRLLLLPYSHELLLEQKLICCNSICNYVQIPISSISVICLPSMNTTKYMGTIKYNGKKIYINANIKGINDMVTDIMNINPNIKVTYSWFPW